MFLTNMTIVLVFTLVFGKVIDPTYPVKMKEVSMAGTEKMMSSMGLDEAQVQEAMAKSEERFDKQFNPSFGEFILQYGISAIMYFIGALIFAAIFKKNNPNPWGDQTEEVLQQE
jgi:CBS-domain-containing membrane protein